MLYPDDHLVKSLRANDPYGVRSTNELNRRALIIQLRAAAENVSDENLRDILETIIDLLFPRIAEIRD